VSTATAPPLTAHITIDHLRRINFWRRVVVEVDVWSHIGYCWSLANQPDTYSNVYVPRRVSGLDRPVGLKGHRVAKSLALGRMLELDEEIDHLCYHPFCVKPNHLEVVTRTENIRRIRPRRVAFRVACCSLHARIR
jgi:hypothetical protein